MGWTRDLWNISYPSLTTSTPFKSQKILCKTEHWIQIHFNQNEIKQTQHSNSRANVKTRTPKLHNLLQFSPPLPSLTFYGLPPPPRASRVSAIYVFLVYCQVEGWVWLQDVYWALIFVGFVNLNRVSFSTLGGFVLIHTTPSHRSSLCSLHSRKPKCSALSNQTVFARTCGELNPSTFFI